MRRLKRAAFAALGGLVALAGAEGASLLTIRLTRPLLGEEIRTTRDIFREQTDRIRLLLAPDTTRLLVLDSVLGWRYRANHRDTLNQTDREGVRSTRSYSRLPGAGRLRVAAFGNSFVYASEVRNPDAWPQVVEDSFPEIEVLNYGVGGYGADQAYLRFQLEGMRLSPRIVIIGFAPDDLGRLVNVYRRFRSNREIPLVKPRYLLGDDGELVLVPSPVRAPADYDAYLRDPRAVLALGRHDQWYEPATYGDPLYDYSGLVRLVTETWIRLRRRYLGPDVLVRGGAFNPSSAAFRLQLALFQQFASAVRAAGARPLVVLFPDREAIARARRGRPTVFASLIAALQGRGIEYVDLTEAFASARADADLDAWFMRGGHYSPLGNRIVARWLGTRLRAQGRDAATLITRP